MPELDLTNVKILKRLLREHKIKPRKHWGQNFLVSKKILSEILTAANIDKTDTILEIGGGVGTLSIEIAKRAKRLIVIERDPSLCKILRNTLAPFNNIEILCQDARKLTPKKLLVNRYSLIANLPYSVGIPILMQLLESIHPPTRCHVMIQKEVAERIISKPPNGTLLGTAMQYLAVIEKLFLIPANATWPIPEVNSAYLRITPREEVSSWGRGHFMKTLRKGFAHPRKKVLSNLCSDALKRTALSNVCKIDENARAQQMTLDQWYCMDSHLSSR